MFYLWLSAARAATCDAITAADLATTVDKLERAFIEVNDTGFDAARAKLVNDLPCVQEALTPVDVAGVHRAMAIVAFYDQNNAHAEAALRAVHRVDPEWIPSDDLFPVGHPLRTSWDSAVVPTTLAKAPYQPPGGWRVDGQAADRVPVDDAAIVQALDDEQHVLETRYVWSLVEFPPAGSYTTFVAKTDRPKKGRAIGTIAGGLLVGGAVGAWAVNSAARTSMDDAPYSQIGPLEKRADAATLSAAALGGIGLTTLAVTWVVAW